MKNKLNLIWLAALALSAAAHAQTTEAWRQIIPGVRAFRGMTPLLPDGNGDIVLNYQAAGTPNQLRLMMMNMFQAPLWDVAVVDVNPNFQMGGMMISPTAVNRLVFVVWNTVDQSSNHVVRMEAFGLNGVAQWSQPIAISNAKGGDKFVSGACDPFGVYLELSDATTGGAQLRMVSLDYNGTVTADATNSEISPNIPRGVAKHSPFTSFYEPEGIYKRWIVEGMDNVTPGNARWGSYSAINGTRVFGGSYAPAGGYSKVDVHVASTHVPGSSGFEGDIVAFVNSYDNPNFSSLLNQTNYDANGNVTNTASAPYYVFNVVPQSETWAAPLNIWGKNAVIHAMNYWGDDGLMLGVNNGYMITFDYGGWIKFVSDQYFYTRPIDAFNWGQPLKLLEYYGIQASDRSIYTYGYTNNPRSGYVVDRFVSGITLASLQIPPSFSGFTTLRVNLNGPAPSGGVRLGLTSFDPILTFQASGTTSVTVSIPAGQSFADVYINAGRPASNTPVSILGQQYGVRRYASTIVLP